MASFLNRILGLLGRAAADAATELVKNGSNDKDAAGTGNAAARDDRNGATATPSAPARGSAPKPGPSARRNSGKSSTTTSAAASGSPGGDGTARVYDVAARGLPDFDYSPDPDGRADPGEVVWTWVPYEEDASRGKDRPVLVLAGIDGDGIVVAQMTSKDHDRDAAQEARWGRHWHDIGSGDWDRQGRPSEVRLDRLLVVDRSAVRREGATVRRDVFDGVVSALQRFWS